MIPRHRGKNLAGISREFIDNPFCFTLAAAQELGDFYRLTLPGYRVFVCSSPMLLKHITATNSRNYVKGRFYWSQLARGIGEGLATTEGPSWLERRRLLQPYFSKGNVNSHITGIAERVSLLFREKINGPGNESITDIMELGNEITSEITLRQLFGLDAAEFRTGFYEKIRRSQEFIYYCSRYPWNRLLTALNGKKKKFTDDVRYFDRLIYSCINGRRQEPSPPSNVLTALLQESRPPLNDQQVRDEFITLLGGGSENSSTCFAWTIYLLWKHPEKLIRLRKEVDALLEPGQLPDETALQQMQFTGNVLKESLRLYPSGYAIIREAKAEDRIGDTIIPKGSTLYFAVNVLHRHKNYWKEAEQFLPERFEAGESETAIREAYIPFGAGQHSCIGSHFALAELKVMLSLLVRQYDFTLARPEPVNIISRMTPHPEGGLPFRFVKRTK